VQPRLYEYTLGLLFVRSPLWQGRAIRDFLTATSVVLRQRPWCSSPSG